MKMTVVGGEEEGGLGVKGLYESPMTKGALPHRCPPAAVCPPHDDFGFKQEEPR